MPGLLVGLPLAGLAAGPARALDDESTVKLEAQNSPGQSGCTTLFADGEPGRHRTFEWPPGIAQPAHLHAGSCDRLDEAPKWPPQPLKGGSSVTLVKACAMKPA